MLHGVVIGAAVGVVGALWTSSMVFGAVVATAMLGVMLSAGVAGTLIPFALRRLGQDPAVGAGVLVTTATDIVGFFVLLGLATLFLSYLA